MFDIAYAASTSGAASGTGMGSTILMIVLMIAIFYFLMIRPENKRKKQAEEMLAMRLAVMHNLYFYNKLTLRIRDSINEGSFDAFRETYSKKLAERV